MADYRIYFLDRNGHIEEARNIVCASDVDVVGAACNVMDGRVIEIWQGARKVAVVGEDGKAKRPDGPRSTA